MKKFLLTFGTVILSLGLLTACGGTDTSSEDPVDDEEDVGVEEQVDEGVDEEVNDESEQEVVVEEESEQSEDVPREYKAALNKAKTYAEMMHMSKAGIYDQLVSEYGEAFPAEAAQYAIDNLEWDWKENALKKAKTYADTMSMSDSAIYDQLISEHGEKFTAEEAQYAVDNLK